MFIRHRTLSNNLAFLLAALLAWPGSIPWTSPSELSSGVSTRDSGQIRPGHHRKLDQPGPIDRPDEISISQETEVSDDVPPLPACFLRSFFLMSFAPSSLHVRHPEASGSVPLAPRSPLLRC